MRAGSRSLFGPGQIHPIGQILITLSHINTGRNVLEMHILVRLDCVLTFSRYSKFLVSLEDPERGGSIWRSGI